MVHRQTHSGSSQSRHRPHGISKTRAIWHYCRSSTTEIKREFVTPLPWHKWYAPRTQPLQTWYLTKLAQGRPPIVQISYALQVEMNMNGNGRSFSNPFTDPISIEQTQPPNFICKIVCQMTLPHHFSIPSLGCWAKHGFVAFGPIYSPQRWYLTQ